MPSILNRIRRLSIRTQRGRSKATSQKAEKVSSPVSVLGFDEVLATYPTFSKSYDPDDIPIGDIPDSYNEIPTLYSQEPFVTAADYEIEKDETSQVKTSHQEDIQAIKESPSTPTKDVEEGKSETIQSTNSMKELKIDVGNPSVEIDDGVSSPSSSTASETPSPSPPVQDTLPEERIYECSPSTDQVSNSSKTVASEYNNPCDVPAKCESLIGKLVKVKDSITDPKKRNAVGTVSRWKNKSTIELKCDNGDIHGLRITSIEFVATTSATTNEMETEESTVVQSVVEEKGVEEVGTHGISNEILKSEGSNNLEKAASADSLLPPEEVLAQESCTESVTETKEAEIADFSNESKVSEGIAKDESAASTNNMNPPEKLDGGTESEIETKGAKEANKHDLVINESENSEAIDEIESATSFYYTYPSEVPFKCESILWRRVKVKASMKDSKKKNAVGQVVKWKNKSTVEIECNDGQKFGVRVSNIDFFNGISGDDDEEEVVHERKKEPVLKKETSRTRQLRRSPRSSSTTSFENDGEEKTAARKRKQDPTKKFARKVGRSLRSARSSSTSDAASSSNEGASWRVPGSSNNVMKFGNYPIEKIRLKSDDEKEKSDKTFLDHLLRNRMLTVDVPLNGRKNQKPFDKKLPQGDSMYELVSCKVYDDAQLFGFMKSKLARLLYAKIEGPGLDSFSMEDHLLRISEFSTIPPRKIAARLELFQSPSKLNIVFLDKLDFQDIPDRGYVGGGFISDDKLLEVLETAGMTRGQASQVVAIQVRLFIPSMGLYKGMLVRKRRTDGAPIELPWSMQKVLKSTHPEAMQGAAIVICKIGVHPSPGSANEYIGRKLDPSLRAPPEKSFKEKIKKPLSDMVFRLWQTMGVSNELCNSYKKESLSEKRRNHAWVVGVPDPTNSLPVDTIFVPGMKANGPSEIFVTRSPCYAYEHGRKLEMVSSRPEGMSLEDWDWLNNELSFGVIIFSNPRPGMMSIPERIANGDLDGDLYLICWDKEVLASMTAAPFKDEISDDDGKLSTVPSNSNWFSDAQDIIVDAAKCNEIGNLTGKLYKLAEKIADESEDKLRHPDASAYYEAYNQALEFKKHGRPIRLPSHLIENIPANLRHLLESSDS